ncbi:MAG TPA: cytochrome c oxidase accessory protein CcoG [bacterium]
MNPTPSIPAPLSPPGAAGANLEAELYQFRPPERPSTMDERGRRKWVYPAAIQGLFMRRRRWTGYVLIAIFLITPWLKIGDMQAVWLQIPERRFILFGYMFFPQDSFYLVFLLVGLALGLFFFTALVGRVWCGWACPQTVWMEEVFRKIDWLVEGDHHAQKRLDGAPWSFNKVARKVTKHALFLVFSALVSNTFIAYFAGTENLLHWMLSPPTEHWTAFLFMAAILGVFYFDFAWFREQFCTVLCPYARFQAVLTDADTVQVGYDVIRGEPRGRVGTTKGDCIDCHKCVAVCPTGIDIRNGYQLECIGCARCIDACDSIMDKIGRPQGLIRYDSLARLQGKVSRILRPRVVVYSLLLLGVMVLLFWGLGTRPMLDFTVLRAPGDPFTVLPGDLISNHYHLRVFNRSNETRTFHIWLDGPSGTTLIVPVNPVRIPPGEPTRLDAFVNVPTSAINTGKTNIRFRVSEVERPMVETATSFIAPEKH